MVRLSVFCTAFICRHPIPQIQFVLLLSRQGKVRLAKWYTTMTQKEKLKIIRDITPTVLARPAKLCNFLDWKDSKLVYKRYASLYFVACVDGSDNELITLEIIHHYVEILDRYFGNVCELDLIFNFHKVCGGGAFVTPTLALPGVFHS